MTTKEETLGRQPVLPWAAPRSDRNGKIDYIANGIEAEGHTLVYKMHKYFARRPQNVFRWLVEVYSEPGDIILDCFSGGGVTLFEGLSVGRKVVGVDVNPLATFISDCQTTRVGWEDYSRAMKEIRREVYEFTRGFFTTSCRDCNMLVDVRWCELAYSVACPTGIDQRNVYTLGQTSHIR